jgi:hypothetical protein
MGKTLVCILRGERHAARQWETAARGEVQGVPSAARKAAALARSLGEWVNYAKGNGPVPGSNFQYSGWTTETNHLGNVAYRTGKKLEWDYKSLTATNAPESVPFIKRPEYRKGWGDILKA